MRDLAVPRIRITQLIILATYRINTVIRLQHTHTRRRPGLPWMLYLYRR